LQRKDEAVKKTPPAYDNKHPFPGAASLIGMLAVVQASYELGVDRPRIDGPVKQASKEVIARALEILIRWEAPPELMNQ
jgi:hypothetical protein